MSHSHIPSDSKPLKPVVSDTSARGSVADRLGTYISKRVLAAFVLFGLMSFGFLWLAHEVRGNDTLIFDEWVLWHIHAMSRPGLDTFVRAFTELGGVLFVPAITLFVVWYFVKQYSLSHGLLILFGVGGSSLLNLVLKSYFSRARPELWDRIVVEHSFSFPSGHAMASAALTASVVAALWYTRHRNRAISLGIVYITGIAFTRMYLGVHYPTDILAGWAVSIAWVCVVFAVFARSPQYTPVTEANARDT